MKTQLSILAAVVFTAAGSSTRSRAQDTSGSSVLTPAIADKFTPVEISHVKLSGLLGKHVDLVPNRLIKGQRDAYLKVFEHLNDTNSWRAEHIGKWLETACNTMTYRHDAQLRSTVDGVVERLIQLQQPDGWLGSYGPEYRFHKYDWAANVDRKYVPFYDGPFYDVWCHYLTMGGLIRYHETTGDARALTAAKRIADLLIATFGPGKQDLMLINHDHGFGPAVAIWPVSKLYLLTGDRRYLEFCRYVASQYGRKGKVPIVMNNSVDGRYPFPDWAHIKHCEFELCLAGLAQVYRGTGDPEFFATGQNIYDGYFAPLNDVISLRGFKTPPPGGRVPDTYYAYLETCDIVPMLRWFVELARTTGDVQYLDALEWNLYNALLSRDLPDGRVWPGVDVPNGDFFHCCYSMLAVGLSYIPNWVYFATPNGVMVNFYETSVLNTRVAGVELRVEQQTGYPLDGTVHLAIKPAKPSTFELALRIPAWCRSASVLVNGKAQFNADVKSGAVVRINRRWNKSDQVTLRLDMPARAVRRGLGGKTGTTFATVQRGPLLLALTAKQNPELELSAANPLIEQDGLVRLAVPKDVNALNTSSATFRGQGVLSEQLAGSPERKSVPLIFVPYVYSRVYDKPMPPPKEGVFNVYSEDGLGKDVRVEFPVSPVNPSLK
jgi:DUF1680 family protein